jgi:hypothetical protein
MAETPEVGEEQLALTEPAQRGEFLVEGKMVALEEAPVIFVH